MTTFDHPAITKQLSGSTVRWAPLVTIDLPSGFQRLWPGYGDRVISGQTYRGVGGLGQIEVLEVNPALEATERVYRLFGSDDLVAGFAADADEAAGRELVQYMQFFYADERDAAGNWIEWDAIGDPIEEWWGVMGELRAEQSEVAIGGQITRMIEVPTHNAFVNRRRPANALYSDYDQKARSPGGDDNIFVAMASVNRKYRWPVFS